MHFIPGTRCQSSERATHSPGSRRYADFPKVARIAIGRREDNRVGGRRPTLWNWEDTLRGGVVCLQFGVDQRFVRAGFYRVAPIGATSHQSKLDSWYAFGDVYPMSSR